MKNLIIVFLAIFFISQNARATVLGDLAASMQPGDWAEVTNMNGFNVGNGDMFGSQQGTMLSILEYCDKAVWDPIGKQFLFLGAAHSGGERRFVRYDDATNTWSTRGLCAIFQANACSRPPFPTINTFILHRQLGPNSNRTSFRPILRCYQIVGKRPAACF